MLISLISAQQGVIFQKNSLIDNIPPVAVCDGSEQISLTSVPTKVFANTFDDGSNDETCFSHFLVKRMGEPDAAFKSYIEFTCNDVSSSPVKVVLRAVDCSDNFNDCWSNAYIEDKTKPTVVCPSDVTINCSDDISKYWGTPIANDNCGNVTLTSSIIDATNQCLSGYISKIWTGKDQFNNQSTCTQQIYLKHISDYSVTCPGFYAPQGRQVRAHNPNPDFLNSLSRFKFDGLNTTNFEMETAGIYGLGNTLGHRCLSCNAIVANRVNGEFSSQPEKVIEELIDKVLDTVVGIF